MRFEPVEGWGRLPEGWRYVECAGVAVGSGSGEVAGLTEGNWPLTTGSTGRAVACNFP